MLTALLNSCNQNREDISAIANNSTDGSMSVISYYVGVTAQHSCSRCLSCHIKERSEVVKV